MIYNNFSDLYKKVLINAENNAKQNWYKELLEQDVFLEIVKDAQNWIKEMFQIFWINETLVKELFSKKDVFPELNDRKWVYSWMNNNLKNTILLSVKIAVSFQKPKASIEDFLLALIENKWWMIFFYDFIGINPEDIKKHLSEMNKAWFIDWVSNITNESRDSLTKILKNLRENFFWQLNQEDYEDITPFDQNKWNIKKQDSKTPALDFFSVDLTKEAREKKLDNVIWRDEEVQRLLSILNRKTKNNPVLVWEPWVWKTAIVELLAQKIVAWDVPFTMRDKRILSLDISSIVAWTKYRWEFEARIKQIIDEASKVENEIILFIDEIHTIIWAWWAEWSLDASNILKPAMWRWKIRVIWATTLNEYQKYIEKDSALERRFQKIQVQEPSREDAIEIIKWLRETFEEYHNLIITDDAIKSSVDLSIRYITDRFLPDKAIDLIDEACSLKSMSYAWNDSKIREIKEKIASLQKEIDNCVISQQYEKANIKKDKLKTLEKQIQDLKKKFSIPREKRLKISKEDIQKVLSISTKIPVSDLKEDDLERLKELPKKLKKQIIDQDEAIDALCNAITRSQVWISNPNRPLWSFLFMWPTWVGKTETVKVLAREFYWSEQNLIRIDMSEYADKTWISKLIWANAWYVWYEEWWLLTEKVRKNPYSIVLFDEIEKWDFDVFNLLLQILDEWIITDNKWRKINFKNTIIIMTSNIWQEEFNREANKIWFDTSEKEIKNIKKDYEKIKENIKSSLNENFPPEFINRIDKIIVFTPLDQKAIKKIVNLHLTNLQKRLKELKNIDLFFDNKVINFISKKVYNPEFWAREINRFIIDNIEDLIAKDLISKKISDKITLSIDKNKITIK